MKAEEIILSFLNQLERTHKHSQVYLKQFSIFAKQFDDGFLLKEIIANLEQDNITAENLAKQSYRHENGFTKLLLWGNQNSLFRIRLHFWEGIKNQSSNIHNHRFNFSSHILMGKIKNTTWVLDEEGEQFNYYEYIPRLEKGNYLMANIGNARLRVSDVEIIEEGATYSLQDNVLHASESFSENLITFFIEERVSIGEFAKVYSNKYLNNESLILNSPPLKKEEYLKFLNRISMLLQSKKTSKRNKT